MQGVGRVGIREDTEGRWGEGGRSKGVVKGGRAEVREQWERDKTSWTNSRNNCTNSNTRRHGFMDEQPMLPRITGQTAGTTVRRNKGKMEGVLNCNND